MIPWVHYVPVQLDYSDLYNIMSFFSGPPSHDGVHTGREVGNDDLARVIAEAGRKFGEEHWRWVDMQGYMFRLLLEYVPSSSLSFLPLYLGSMTASHIHP
jgi:hypothetical protein